MLTLPLRTDDSNSRERRVSSSAATRVRVVCVVNGDATLSCYLIDCALKGQRCLTSALTGFEVSDELTERSVCRACAGAFDGSLIGAQYFNNRK